MRFGFSERCLDHATGDRHPESPDRLRAIRQGLQRRHGVAYAEADPATVEAVERIHDPDYVAEFREFCEDGGGQWDPDTLAVPATWDAALQSAGLAEWVAERAMAGDDGRDTPFSLGRPPGHHAVADDAMGFCFFNNAGVAATHALAGGTDGDPGAGADADADAGADADADAGADADRVVVLDWDVHHGNGTQDLFYERGDVCYASVHEEGLYPGTGEVTETGRGDGAGTTLNVPLPAGAGDVDYSEAVDRVVAPAFEAYDPDLLLVSAGFDAHRHDPISRMRVSTEGYGWLARRLADCADDVGAGLGFVLEGGYGLDVLADSVAQVNEVFDGYDPADPEGDLEPGVEDLLGQLENAHPLL